MSWKERKGRTQVTWGVWQGTWQQRCCWQRVGRKLREKRTIWQAAQLLPGRQITQADPDIVSGEELFYLSSLGQDPHGHLPAHCQWTGCLLISPNICWALELPLVSSLEWPKQNSPQSRVGLCYSVTLLETNPRPSTVWVRLSGKI